VSFPGASSTHSLTHDPYFWVSGDHIIGTAATTLGRTSSANIHLVIGENYLTGDVLDLDYLINGVVVGHFQVPGGTFVYNTTLTYAPQPGPNYTLEFLCTRTVNPGAGSITVDRSASTVTLNP
jgi:hypothetical protein